MRRTLLTVLSVLLVLVLSTSAVFAGTGFFNGGVGFKTGSLVASGKYVGYGNQNLFAQLTGYGTVKTECENRSGKEVPGRYRFPVTAKGFFAGFANGNTIITLRTNDPSEDDELEPTPQQAGCPSGYWYDTGLVEGSTKWTGARITIWKLLGYSGGHPILGNVLFDQSYTCVTTFSGYVATGVNCTPVP